MNSGGGVLSVMNVNLNKQEECFVPDVGHNGKAASRRVRNITGGVRRLGLNRNRGKAAPKPSLAMTFPPTEILVKSKSKGQPESTSASAKETGSSSGSGSGSGISSGSSSGAKKENATSGPKDDLDKEPANDFHHVTSDFHQAADFSLMRDNQHKSGRSVASVASSITNESILLNNELMMTTALEASRWQQNVHSTEEWSCGTCTYLNRPMFLTCEMCGLSKPARVGPNLPKRIPTLDSLPSKRDKDFTPAPPSNQALAFGDGPPSIPRRNLSASTRASRSSSSESPHIFGLAEIAADRNLEFASWGNAKANTSTTAATTSNSSAKANAITNTDTKPRTMKVLDVDDMAWEEQSYRSTIFAASNHQPPKHQPPAQPQRLSTRVIGVDDLVWEDMSKGGTISGRSINSFSV